MLKRFPVVFLLLTAVTSGCKKQSPNATNTGVPNVAVNFTIDTYNVQYNNLTVVGGWMYVTGGYLNHGIIIYRASQTQFYAMDRTCTYNNSGYVTMEKNSPVFAIDSSCGSVFTISAGGIVNKGPATIALKQYQTNFDGEYLTVSN